MSEFLSSSVSLLLTSPPPKMVHRTAQRLTSISEVSESKLNISYSQKYSTTSVSICLELRRMEIDNNQGTL